MQSCCEGRVKHAAEYMFIHRFLQTYQRPSSRRRSNRTAIKRVELEETGESGSGIYVTTVYVDFFAAELLQRLLRPAPSASVHDPLRSPGPT